MKLKNNFIFLEVSLPFHYICNQYATNIFVVGSFNKQMFANKSGF